MAAGEWRSKQRANAIINTEAGNIGRDVNTVPRGRAGKLAKYMLLLRPDWRTGVKRVAG